MSGWAEYQTAEEMEINRKYEYDPESIPFMCKWLCPSPKPFSVVVDVGCGSGYFTKILAGCMKENGKVVGIDPDRRLIQEAEKICKRKHISNINFKIGNVWKIPLESNYADLVVSHIVLSNIPRQFDAILEMHPNLPEELRPRAEEIYEKYRRLAKQASEQPITL